MIEEIELIGWFGLIGSFDRHASASTSKVDVFHIQGAIR